MRINSSSEWFNTTSLGMNNSCFSKVSITGWRPSLIEMEPLVTIVGHTYLLVKATSPKLKITSNWAMPRAVSWISLIVSFAVRRKSWYKEYSNF